MEMLLSASDIREGVKRVAQAINKDYENKPLTIIGVMTGSIIFLSDLIRLLDMPLRVGCIQIKSYEETKRGELAKTTNLSLDVKGHDVLLVDDIFDTGHTMAWLKNYVSSEGAKTVSSVCLLTKNGTQETGETPCYIAFEIPNKFVIGYGLDFDETLRNLPYIAAFSDGEI